MASAFGPPEWREPSPGATGRPLPQAGEVKIQGEAMDAVGETGNATNVFQSDFSIFQKIGVAGPSSTPERVFRHALAVRYCPSGT